MSQKQYNENVILNDKHILLFDNEDKNLYHIQEFRYIKDNFCGIIISDINEFNKHTKQPNTLLYVCGDIKEIVNQISIINIKIINVVEELSNNYELIDIYQLISLGEVPINMFNVGVFFRKFFNSDKDYYNSITNEHQFQTLGMGHKPGVAYRKGIYLTKVDEIELIKGQSCDEIKFKLLRCSTNLNGPTDNFRLTDNEVVNKVNNISKFFYFFRDGEGIELNHVLAQTYHNTVLKNKARKAKIAEHSPIILYNI
jgi:hypothetical protein